MASGNDTMTRIKAETELAEVMEADVDRQKQERPEKIMEDFDIRRAIIHSEILNAKYIK